MGATGTEKVLSRFNVLVGTKEGRKRGLEFRAMGEPPRHGKKGYESLGLLGVAWVKAGESHTLIEPRWDLAIRCIRRDEDADGCQGEEWSIIKCAYATAGTDTDMSFEE